METGPKPSEAGVTTPRALGRIVLAGMMVVLVGLIALPLGLAQAAQTIEFLNPSPDSAVVSDEANFPYGITATISEVPANPRVEFRLKNSGGTVVAGPFTGVQTANSTDTFQYDWAVDDALAEGNYTLEATLYKDFTGVGTGTVVDTDEQAVEVNQATEPAPLGLPAAENVKIAYPVNGGPLGVSIPATGGSSFLIEGDATLQTSQVQGFYTTSPVGTEPTFTDCTSLTAVSDADANGSDEFKLRCVVAEEDFGLNVTGVQVRPTYVEGPLPIQTAVGASDGHRVKPYFQRPTLLTIDPEMLSNATTSTCQSFTATVTDQQSRPIAGGNVDVHAQGPDEGLKFDVGTAFGSTANKGPDKGDHTAETGFLCNAQGNGGSAGAAGSQGSHAVAGQTSRKHVEAAVAGTNNNGKFIFALYTTATGTTQITAFADLDDDDLLCNAEAKDSASIGWGAAAPAVTPETPSVPTCTVADPSPGASATASATTSATASATTSPTTSPTASPTVSPSPSPTGEPRVNERNISLTIKHAKKKMHKAKGLVTLKDAGDFEGCTQNVPVTLQKRKKGKWVTVGNDTTNNAGKYAIKSPHKHGRYRAVAPEVEKDGGQEICSRAKKTFKFKH